MAANDTRAPDVVKKDREDAGGKDTVAAAKYQRFMLKHLVGKGHAFTHTSLGKPSGSYYIPNDALSDFYRLYSDALEGNDDLYITEKHRHISPIVIDLDFRFNLGVGRGDSKRRYTRDHVAQILDVYCEEICKLFDVNQFRVFVMEKPRPVRVSKGDNKAGAGAGVTAPPSVNGDADAADNSNKMLKDGIHIVIPDVVSKPSVQYVLRNNVIKRFGKFFEGFGVVNKLEDIIDEAVIERNNWLMYGSKKPGGESYEITEAYLHVSGDSACEGAGGSEDDTDSGSGGSGRRCIIDDIESDMSMLDVVTLLSIRNKHDETKVRQPALAAINEYEEIMERRRRKMETARAIMTDEINTQENEHQDYELVCKLIEILSPSRANSYNDWIRLGWCLRNIDHRLLGNWVEFSRNSPKFKEGECDRMWRHMKTGGGLGVGTLHMWAKQDNPEKYNEFVRKDLRKLIYESKTGTHNDVARVLYNMYKHDFVCASIKNRTWYEFRKHRWIASDSAFTLRMRMSEEVWKEYVAAARDLSSRAIESNNTEEQERLHDIAQKLHGVATKLKTTSFKDNVMKECAELFYIEKFEERLDSRENLIGFDNGVFDLDTMEFREGRPEDYVSYTTTCDYVEYDPTCMQLMAVKQFLSQILPKASVREYVLKLFATFLHGSVKEQKFNIWTGSGSNGKSICITLFEKAFGDYCCKFPITLLTQKRAASNAATSELARAKGKRFASLQEPSEGEHINCGLMKELSGGDKIMARSLFKEPIEFVPQFKMVLLCNHLPHVPSDDGGTWRRIRVVEFTSKFVDNPVEENEYPIDYDLPNKLDSWRSHFMALLLEYYKLYKVEGMTEPEEVMKCTNEYKRQNDHLAEFIHTCIEKKESKVMYLNDAFNELKSWVKDDNIPIKIPTKAELEKYFAKQGMGRCVIVNNLKAFKGYAIKSRFQTSSEEADGLD